MSLPSNKNGQLQKEKEKKNNSTFPLLLVQCKRIADPIINDWILHSLEKVTQHATQCASLR